MSDKLPMLDLETFIGMLMFGPKYFDYVKAPITDPPGKYPYPRAIEQFNEAIEYVTRLMDRREIEGRLDALRGIKELPVDVHNPRNYLLIVIDYLEKHIAQLEEELKR